MGYLYGRGEVTPGPIDYSMLIAGPFGDEATAEFSTALLKGELIGKNPKGATDILTVSFSSHDCINYNFGLESIQSMDHLIRLDRTLTKFCTAIDAQVWREDVLML